MDGACDNMTPGVDGADDICESRYTEDVASEHRTTIMEQHETGTLQHKALLASNGGDSNLPQNFDINGKDSYPIRRPDSDSTQIAPNWAAFFNAEQDLDNAVSGTEDLYWTGLFGVSGPNFTLAAVPSTITGLYNTYLCEDWSTKDEVSSGKGNLGTRGRGDEVGTNRLDNRIGGGTTPCNDSRVLLCITH